MKGMELSKKYFNEIGLPMIEREYKEYKRYMAFGLVGEGSECYGYDDEISEDHDFGPGFCIWIPESIYRTIGLRLQNSYDKLPKNFMGYNGRKETKEGKGRVGVFSIESFYSRYTNCGGIPLDNQQWFKIPDNFLSTATNGEVFFDYYGEFSNIRNGLKEFYPEDVILKKLSAKIAKMSQSGQYNYVRSIKREDYEAAYMSCSEFVKATLSVAYLLNKEYMPFYKWVFKGSENFLCLNKTLNNLKKIIRMSDDEKNSKQKIFLIEEICKDIVKELNYRKISSINDEFLINHCSEVMGKINDIRLRTLNVMIDLG